MLTSNKRPNEWRELLGNPGITTAILDRILQQLMLFIFMMMIVIE
ncbi:ATP-binding protein [Oceanobacillus oncorhynchi]